MSILIAAVLGAALGFTSHIRQSKWNKVIGVIEGLVVVSVGNWIFYNIGLWWWASILLGIVVYAIYLIFIQSLMKTRVVVDQLP